MPYDTNCHVCCLTTAGEIRAMESTSKTLRVWARLFSALLLFNVTAICLLWISRLPGKLDGELIVRLPIILRSYVLINSAPPESDKLCLLCLCYPQPGHGAVDEHWVVDVPKRKAHRVDIKSWGWCYSSTVLRSRGPVIFAIDGRDRNVFLKDSSSGASTQLPISFDFEDQVHVLGENLVVGRWLPRHQCRYRIIRLPSGREVPIRIRGSWQVVEGWLCPEEKSLVLQVKRRIAGSAQDTYLFVVNTHGEVIRRYRWRAHKPISAVTVWSGGLYLAEGNSVWAYAKGESVPRIAERFSRSKVVLSLKSYPDGVVARIRPKALPLRTRVYNLANTVLYPFMEDAAPGPFFERILADRKPDCEVWLIPLRGEHPRKILRDVDNFAVDYQTGTIYFTRLNEVRSLPLNSK